MGVRNWSYFRHFPVCDAWFRKLFLILTFVYLQVGICGCMSSYVDSFKLCSKWEVFLFYLKNQSSTFVSEMASLLLRCKACPNLSWTIVWWDNCIWWSYHFPLSMKKHNVWRNSWLIHSHTSNFWVSHLGHMKLLPLLSQSKQKCVSASEKSVSWHLAIC